MIILSMGFSILEFYHLMTHTIFKSLLFLCAGIVVHLIKNNQNIRHCENLREIIPFVKMDILCINFINNRVSIFI